MLFNARIETSANSTGLALEQVRIEAKVTHRPNCQGNSLCADPIEHQMDRSVAVRGLGREEEDELGTVAVRRGVCSLEVELGERLCRERCACLNPLCVA